MATQHLLTRQGERVAVVSGVRTPFVNRDGGFKSSYATDLGTIVTNELLSRTVLEHHQVEQLVFGQVIQQPDIPNPSREIALALNMPNTQSYTISSSCISGLQAVANVASSIVSGSISCGIAGGADSISNAPFSISPRVVYKLKQIFKAPSLEEKYRRFRSFSWRDLTPRSVDLKDYMTQLSVAEISEQIAQQFHINRTEQDEYARLSNQKAQDAWKIGLFKEEVLQAFPRPYSDFVISDTLCPQASRRNYYESLPTLLDKSYATVTEGNIPQAKDGAAAVLLMRENQAKALGLMPLGYIRSYAVSGNDIWQNMFMGSVLASHRALERAGMSLAEMDLIDIHETSSAQMLATMRLFESEHFAKNQLNRSACLGTIDPAKLNILGGSIAFGNPRAATSLRILIQSLYALKRRGGGVSLVAGGGLGGLGSAMVLESE